MKGTSADIRSIDWNRAKDNPLSSRIYRVLMNWVRFADASYHDWDIRPRCGHFFSGSYWHGKETSTTLVAYAVLAVCGSYDSEITGIPREDIKEKAIRAIRYLGFTHDTGPQDCVRPSGDIPSCAGTKWGGEDSDASMRYFREMCSGKVIGDFALAAWLLWSELDEETRGLVYTVVSYFANKYTKLEPRNGTYLNTQCEENGWVACGISTAVALFPSHPNHGKWKETLKRYTEASVSVPQAQYTTPRLGTVTFHPDYTAENHRFVHPTYMQLGIILKSKHLLLQSMAGQAPDSFALAHNRELLDRVLAVWSQFDGLTIPVQGQSWWYNSYHNLILVHGILRVFHNSSEAAFLQEQLMIVAEKLQNSNSRGCLLEENGENIIVVPKNHQKASHMEYDSISQMAESYLLHLFGGPGAKPASREEMIRKYKGVYTYPFGSIAVHRTDRSFSGFSWRNHVIAYCLPDQGLWLTTPLFNSYIGNVWMPEDEIVIDEEQQVYDTVKHELTTWVDGFAAMAELQRRRQPDIRQNISFISLPDGRAVYAEMFSGEPGTQLQAIHTGTVGVRNENYRELSTYACGRRTLYWQEGDTVSSKVFKGFLGREANETTHINAASFVNIDHQIGYVLSGSQGVRYYNRHHYRKWRGLEDVLILNCSEGSRIDSKGQGERFAMIVFPNRTLLETRDEAMSASFSFGMDYFIAETGEWMAYANYGERQTVQFTKQITDAGWNIYEGSQTLSNGSSIWHGTLEEYRSGYRPAVLKLECASLIHLDMEVCLSGDRCSIDNRSNQEVKIVWTILKTGENGSFYIDANNRVQGVYNQKGNFFDLH